MEINLNDIVETTLSAAGKAIVRERYQELALIHPTVFNEAFIERTCSRSKWQLWQLFEIFGNDIGLGKASPFMDNSILIKKD